MSKSWGWDKTRSSYDHKFVCSDNLGQSILKEVKKFIKIGQGYEAWVSTLT